MISNINSKEIQNNIKEKEVANFENIILVLEMGSIKFK